MIFIRSCQISNHIIWYIITPHLICLNCGEKTNLRIRKWHKFKLFQQGDSGVEETSKKMQTLTKKTVIRWFQRMWVPNREGTVGSVISPNYTINKIKILNKSSLVGIDEERHAKSMREFGAREARGAERKERRNYLDLESVYVCV